MSEGGVWFELGAVDLVGEFLHGNHSKFARQVGFS